MDLERKLIIKELQSNESKRLMKVNTDNTIFKDSEKSKKARAAGNEVFLKNTPHDDDKHQEAWRLYSKSIAMAPSNSEELALAYGNRSALLVHFKKYKESMLDIEKAVKLTKSTALKVKLFSRKAECLTALGLSENRKAWEEAKFYLSQIKDGDKDKNAVTRILNRVEKDLDNLKVVVEKVDHNPVKKSKPSEIFNSVEIKYNEKYGRHVIAKRDFTPGEIVFTEKPYIYTLNPYNNHAYCGHCLKLSWASIPCDNCCWIMFCSEDCKSKAWNEYHFVECTVVPRIIYDNSEKERTPQFTIRALLKGITETGSLDNLRKEVDDLDKCTDESKKGFSKDGKFENDKFHSMYHTTKFVPPKPRDSEVKAVAKTLIFLARYTTIFGKDYKFNDGLNFTSNEDVVFVGSLLLKLAKVFGNNLCPVTDCKEWVAKCTCKTDHCSNRGEAFSIVTSLVDHNCDSNLRTVYTDDVNMLFYAVMPIKKNEVLFKSHTFVFYNTDYQLRREPLKTILNTYCDCRACKEQWPTDMDFKHLMMRKTLKEQITYGITSSMKNIQYREILNTRRFQHDAEFERLFCNEETIAALRDDIIHVYRTFGHPTSLIYDLIVYLVLICDRFYGCTLQMQACKKS